MNQRPGRIIIILADSFEEILSQAQRVIVDEPGHNLKHLLLLKTFNLWWQTVAFVKLRQGVHLPQLFNEIVVRFVALSKDVAELPSFGIGFDLIRVPVGRPCSSISNLLYTLISTGSRRWLIFCITFHICHLRFVCFIHGFILLRIFRLGTFGLF